MSESPSSPENQPDESIKETSNEKSESPTTETSETIPVAESQSATDGEVTDSEAIEEQAEEQPVAQEIIVLELQEGDTITSTEKTWASLAHLSILLNLITGILGPLTALIIYLVFKDKSRYVAYQSMQAFIFQLIWWVAAGILAAILWIISIPLLIIIIGCCLMPIALFFSMIPIAALVYGVIAAIETSQGKDFKYWLIGEWVRGILTEE